MFDSFIVEQPDITQGIKKMTKAIMETASLIV